MDFLGFHIRQYRVGKHQSGKSPRGAQRLGYKTLITPAKVNVKAHLAELGRIIRQGQDWPQAALIRKLNPNIRGWANFKCAQMQPRPPPRAWRAALPGIYGLPSLAVACGTTPLTPLTYFR